MEPTYLLTWIGAVGLVTLATYACFCLLKHGQRLEDVESESLWQYLLNPGGPEPGVKLLGRFISSASPGDAGPARDPIEIRSSFVVGLVTSRQKSARQAGARIRPS